MKSTDFLQAAINVQTERAKQYDSPEGERSMGRTVAAFNAITGRDLTEAEGWLILLLLKQVRQWQNPGQYHHDSALDGVAYASLLAEALHAAGGKAPTVVPTDDMSDWRNWQVGDIVEWTSSAFDSVVTSGNLYKVTKVGNGSVWTEDDDGSSSALEGDELVEYCRWHSRPTA